MLFICFCLFVFSWWPVGSSLQITRMRTLEASGIIWKLRGSTWGHVRSVWDKTQQNITEIQFRAPLFVKCSTRFDLVGCSGGPLEPPWDAFGFRHQKTTKKQLFRVPFLGTFCVFETSLLPVFSAKSTLQASISKGFGCHLEHNLNKYGKVETAIPCGKGCENQALEGLCFTLFCHFHVQVSGTSFFHDSFDDLSQFYAFVHPLEAHF